MSQLIWRREQTHHCETCFTCFSSWWLLLAFLVDNCSFIFILPNDTRKFSRARHLKDTNARSPSAVSRARVCWSWVQHLLPLRMTACWGDVVQPGACVHIFVLYDYVCAVGVPGRHVRGGMLSVVHH